MATEAVLTAGCPTGAGCPAPPRTLQTVAVAALLVGLLLMGLLVFLGPRLGGPRMMPAIYSAEKWGPFRGRIVDIDTGQPIEGGAVVAMWYQMHFHLVHGTESFFDAREAVSDAEGRFEIPRRPAPLIRSLLGITAPRFSVFVPGYESAQWVVTPPDGPRFVAPTELRMRRLTTRKARLAHLDLYPPGIPHEKMPLFLEAVDRERRALGFTPYYQR